MTRYAAIIGTGSYLPERVMTNAELETMVDTSDEWIVSRSGIQERRIVAEGESTSDLAARAARIAMDRAGVTRRPGRPAAARHHEPRLHHAVDGVHDAGQARADVPGGRPHGRLHELHLRAAGRRGRHRVGPRQHGARHRRRGAHAARRLHRPLDVRALRRRRRRGRARRRPRSRASRPSSSARTARAPTSSSSRPAAQRSPPPPRRSRRTTSS